MNGTSAEARARIIPRPAAVRVELARSVREARRLRSLLRVAIAAEQDRAYVDSLTVVIHREATGECAGMTAPTA